MRKPTLIALWAVVFLSIAAMVGAQQQSSCTCCGQPLPAEQSNVRSGDVPAARGELQAPTSGPGQSLPFQETQGISILGYRVTIVTLAIIGGLASCVLVMFYFLVLVPWRNRRPMFEAFEIIDRDQLDNFSKAEEKLTIALTAGLKGKDIAEARFALAYVRARIGSLVEATAVIEDLRKFDKLNRESVYLELWLHAQQKHDDKVAEIYSENSENLENLLDTPLIVSISLLRLAKLRWSRREVDGALHYFAQIRELGVLSDEIPDHIDDHRVVFGLLALFDKDFEAARKHFSSAVQSEKSNDKATYASELGLLLCRWSEGELSEIDEDLGKQIILIEKADPIRSDGMQQINSAEDYGTISESSTNFILRGALLWHAVVLLHSWLRRKPRSSLTPDDREALGKRLDRVRKIDSRMGDPDFIEGLIDYYFSFEEASKKRKAIEKLELAVKHDVNIPEVHILLEREKDLSEMERKGLERFLLIVKEWIRNPEVPLELRKEFYERYHKDSRFRELGEVDIVEGDPELAPSVADMQNRAIILHKRINQLVRPKLFRLSKDDADNVDKSVNKLDKTIKTMSKLAKKVEQNELSLLMTTGEFLFRDETEGSDTADAKRPT